MTAGKPGVGVGFAVGPAVGEAATAAGAPVAAGERKVSVSMLSTSFGMISATPTTAPASTISANATTTGVASRSDRLRRLFGSGSCGVRELHFIVYASSAAGTHRLHPRGNANIIVLAVGEAPNSCRRPWTPCRLAQ